MVLTSALWPDNEGIFDFLFLGRLACSLLLLLFAASVALMAFWISSNSSVSCCGRCEIFERFN